MSTRRTPEKLLVGSIGKPHGLLGDVNVWPVSDDPTRFQPGSHLLDPDGHLLVVERARSHGDRLIIKFEGVDRREGAEQLRGSLYVTLADGRSLDADEYWQHDLVGCTAFDVDGNKLGDVGRVTPGAAHDLLVVETPGGERLVPVVKAIIKEVDVHARRIVVDPPEGLL